MARLAAYHPRDVAMPGGIVREHDVTRPEAPYRAVAGFDFYLSGEGNDVLAPRRVVIIAEMSRGGAAKENPMRRLERGNLHMADKVKFYIDLFEMRFVVRSRVKSNDLHQPVCKRIGREKQGNGEA